MVKQKPQLCLCGLEVNLPDGEVKTLCTCGRSWEINTEGVLFTNLRFAFEPVEKVVPFLTKGERVRNKRKRRAGLK